MAALSDLEKCKAMLRWSAVPGASRHHWGTEIDIFDPDLLPENTPLLLEPGIFGRWLFCRFNQVVTR